MTEIDKHIKILLDKKDIQNLNSFEELGYIFLGPLIFNFFIWLKEELGNTDKILFNSREGHFLQQLYRPFKEKYNLPESAYFKTSRKISALSSFQTKEDIYDTFKLHRYSGTLSNLLLDRFGITNIKNDKYIDSQIEIPNLDKYINEILEISKNIRKEYSQYIQEIIGYSKNIMMIDSGFQGMTQYSLQKAFGLKCKGRYFIYKGNPLLEDVKGLYDFEQSNFKQNLIFFESIFIDSVGSYINIKNGNFINEHFDNNLQFLDEKRKIIVGIEMFINDMFDFNIQSEEVSYVYSDYIFDLMCKKNYIKNNSLFDIFFHDNYYVRDSIKKIIRNKL